MDDPKTFHEYIFSYGNDKFSIVDGSYITVVEKEKGSISLFDKYNIKRYSPYSWSSH